MQCTTILGRKARPTAGHPQRLKFFNDLISTDFDDIGNVFKKNEFRFNLVNQSRDMEKQSTSVRIQAFFSSCNANVLAWETSINDVDSWPISPIIRQRFDIIPYWSIRE